MYGFTADLTHEEQLALAIMTGQHLKRILSPFMGDNILIDGEVMGEKVGLLSKDIKLNHAGYFYEQLGKLHGNEFIYTESILKRLVGIAKIGNVNEIFREDEILSQGLGIVSHQTGSFTLFDSPVETNCAVNFTFMQADYIKSKLNREDELPSATDGRRHVEFYLSSEQYGRMVRMNSTEVPCTIYHYRGQSNDAPPVEMKTQNKIKSSLRQELDILLQPLHNQAAEVIDLLLNKALTSKKAILELRTELDKFQAMYKDVEGALCGFKLDAAQDTIEQYMKEIQREVNKEVMRLPEHKRNMIPTFRIGSI